MSVTSTGLARGHGLASSVSNAQERAATHVRNRDGFAEGSFVQWSLGDAWEAARGEVGNSIPARGGIVRGCEIGTAARRSSSLSPDTRLPVSDHSVFVNIQLSCLFKIFFLLRILDY